MKDDREDDKIIHVDLDDETVAHYERRAEAAGRTLEAQIHYELEVNHGLALPDVGDVEATQRRQIFRRISTRRILQG